MGSLRSRKQINTSGFTLIEALVTVAIISILTVLVASSYPIVRQQQQVRVAEQLLGSQLRRAQQLALNENREVRCLQLFADQVSLQPRCSDIGIAIRGSEFIMFADTDADTRFTSGSDYIISNTAIGKDVSIPNKDFLFKATPPTITAYTDGVVQSLKTPQTLVIAVGSLQVPYDIYPYGYIEEAKP